MSSHGVRQALGVASTLINLITRVPAPYLSLHARIYYYRHVCAYALARTHHARRHLGSRGTLVPSRLLFFVVVLLVRPELLEATLECMVRLLAFAAQGGYPCVVVCLPPLPCGRGAGRQPLYHASFSFLLSPLVGVPSTPPFVPSPP